ncbi:MAG: hypothetical protein O2857_27495 [Planctomycetota bacterium]|nr:hypothetical protein [Planctomycetota bacterium]
MNNSIVTPNQNQMYENDHPAKEKSFLSQEDSRKHLPASAISAHGLQKKNYAHTLPELLVVIGILAGAFSVVPSMVLKAKGNGGEVSCRNHLRQVVMGYRLYVSEYRTVPDPGLDDHGIVKLADHVQARCYRRHPRGKGILKKIFSAPHRFVEFKKHHDCLRCHTTFPELRQATANTSDNRLGYFTHTKGFKPQGLGRLLADGFIGDPEFLYCPSDTVLLSDNEIGGVKSSNNNWIFKYPQLGSFITRPFGITGEKEQPSALHTDFFSNSGRSVFLAEISGNHRSGVHFARLNGSVDKLENVPIYARASSAFGARWVTADQRGIERLREPAYRFHFSMSPWIWQALDNPEIAEKIVAHYPEATEKDDEDDHEDVPSDIDHDDDHGGDGNDHDDEDDHNDHKGDHGDDHKDDHKGDHKGHHDD